MMPKRIQRKRTRGWRMPEGVICVSRGTKWGNPFKVGEPVAPVALIHTDDIIETLADAADYFDQIIGDHQEWVEYIGVLPDWAEKMIREIDELRGKDLACWCKLGSKCHADTLLRAANR